MTSEKGKQKSQCYYGDYTAYLQVIGCGVEDTVPCISLLTEHQRYLFNCCEGSQRVFGQHKIKLGKLDKFFLTRLKWSHFGGLLGMGITLTDIGKSQLCVYGPRGLRNGIKEAKRFLRYTYDSCQFRWNEFSEEPDTVFKDRQMKLFPVHIYPTEQERHTGTTEGPTDVTDVTEWPTGVTEGPTGVTEGPTGATEGSTGATEWPTGATEGSTDAAVGDAQDSPEIDNLINTVNCQPSKNPATLCYIAEMKDKPGKFLIDKAVELGVPKGKMCALLKRGQDVVLDNGKEIKSKDVVDAVERGPIFIIIDCPSTKYIPPIVTNQQLANYHKNSNGKNPNIVIHLVTRDILENFEYKQWMSRFDASTYHWILDKERLSHPPVVFQSQHLIQYKLNQLHPKVFPLIEQWDEEHKKEISRQPNEIVAKNMSIYHLRNNKMKGRNAFDDSKILITPDTALACKQALIVLTELPNNCDLIEDNKLLPGVNDKEENRSDNNVCMTTDSDVSRCYEPSQLKLCPEETSQLKLCPEEASSCENEKKRKQQMEEVEFVIESKRRVLEHNNSITSVNAETGRVLQHDNVITNVNEETGRVSQHDNSITSANAETGKSVFEKVTNNPKIVFLGTGASLPSKYRNVSSILVYLSADRTALLDCGEGTYGQLVSHYGDCHAKQVIRNLEFVFISHMHADHHLGLIRILKHYNKVQGKDNEKQPLLVIAPQSLLPWLQGYANNWESLSFSFIDCDHLKYNSPSINPSELLKSMTNISTVIVKHHKFIDAYGITLSHEEGWKLTYSGDTVPCQSLVDAGKDSTVLIHEATFEDDLEEEAKHKYHSTVSQAMDIASKMNAKAVLLTHFSQRYPKIPMGLNNETSPHMAIAFDHMEIYPMDIPEISALLPKLKLLCPDHDVD